MFKYRKNVSAIKFSTFWVIHSCMSSFGSEILNMVVLIRKARGVRQQLLKSFELFFMYVFFLKQLKITSGCYFSP